MDPRSFPTKGNLILAKNSLTLARQGYELMDKKRNILIRELMGLIDEAKDIQEEIDKTFTYAYQCLQRANIEHGISTVEELAYTVPIELLPDWLRKLVEYCNPMFYYIQFFRDLVLYRHFTTPRIFIGCWVMAFIMLSIGLGVFKKTQDNFILYI